MRKNSNIVDKSDKVASPMVGVAPGSSYNVENVLALRSRIFFIVKNKKLAKSQRDFLAKTGIKMTYQRFSDWLKEEKNWNYMNEFNYKLALDYLVENQIWQDDDYVRSIKHVDDSLFHSLVDFLQIHQEVL